MLSVMDFRQWLEHHIAKQGYTHTYEGAGGAVSVRTFAEALKGEAGLTRIFLSKLLNHDRELTAVQALVLAKKLDLDVEELIQRYAKWRKG